MDNINFIESMKEFIVIWWSYAIKKQIKDFREPKDIDIEISWRNWDIFEFRLKKQWVQIDESKYSSYSIYICTFPDKSTIDIILHWTLNTSDITTLNTWLRYRSVKSIIGKKLELINNSPANENVANKHIKDIIWLLNNWYQIVKT